MFTKANGPNKKDGEERRINAALIPLIAHDSVQLVHLKFQETAIQSFVGSFVKLLHTFSTALESGLWPDRTRTWTLLFLSHASDDFTESFRSSGSSHNGGFSILFIYLIRLTGTVVCSALTSMRALRKNTRRVQAETLFL